MLTFPARLLQPREPALYLAAQRRSPGRTGGGMKPTTISSGPGRWVYELNDIHLRTRDQQRVFGSLEALTDSGAAPLIVAVCPAANPFTPWPAGVTAQPSPVPHSDGTFFDDGTGYQGGAIVASLVGEAAMNAVTVTIRMSVGGALTGNEHFSLTHNVAGRRMYKIGGINAIDGDDYTVTIRPWLRQATTDAMVVDFNTPSFEANLPDPGSFRMPLAGRRSTVSLVFEEYFDAVDLG